MFGPLVSRGWRGGLKTSKMHSGSHVLGGTYLTRTPSIHFLRKGEYFVITRPNTANLVPSWVACILCV